MPPVMTARPLASAKAGFSDRSGGDHGRAKRRPKATTVSGLAAVAQRANRVLTAYKDTPNRLREDPFPAENGQHHSNKEIV